MGTLSFKWSVRICRWTGGHVRQNRDGFNLCGKCGMAMTPDGEPLGYESDRSEFRKDGW